MIFEIGLKEKKIQFYDQIVNILRTSKFILTHPLDNFSVV